MQSAVESPAEIMLTDLRAFIEGKPGIERFASETLVGYLAGLDARPWSGLNTYKLSTLLEPFGIRPTAMRINRKSVRGYERAQFADAFARYAQNPATPATPETVAPVAPVAPPTDDLTPAEQKLASQYAVALATVARS
jgi:hypothetical protein